MKQVMLQIAANEKIADGVYEIKLTGDLGNEIRPGGFVNIKLDGYYLRRPISVCDVEGDTLTLIYKVLGHGTKDLSTYEKGKYLDVLVGLGNGYNLERSGEKPLLIGGGVGLPPMYMTCKMLTSQGKKVTVIMGAASKADLFYQEKFRALGAEVIETTADGSAGIKGFVTDAMDDIEYSYFYTCGPTPMLKAVYSKAVTDGEFSFEERMGCGFGACMGCSTKTRQGYKRVCKEGPVFTKEEILWED